MATDAQIDLFQALKTHKFELELVRGVNRLLNEPAHRELAQSALKRFRLDHAG